MRRCLLFILLFAASVSAARAAQNTPENLPLGLPADQAVPLKLDGYRLVSLDRTKEVVFVVGEQNLKLKVDVPLFIYLPERDHAAEMKAGLRAVHAGLSRLAAQKQVSPEEVMTLFLAMDRVLSSGELPVQSPTSEAPAQTPPKSAPAKAATPEHGANEDVNPLEAALRSNG